MKGSSLDNRGSGNYTQLTLTAISSGQLADILGTLNWYGSGVTTIGALILQTTGSNVTTVTSTGIIKHNSGTITSAASRLVFVKMGQYMNIWEQALL